MKTFNKQRIVNLEIMVKTGLELFGMRKGEEKNFALRLEVNRNDYRGHFCCSSAHRRADCSALGSILIPAMQKEGYGSKFAGAINATASTMGIIIPPSIPMILTGAATGLSIRDLFFGGLGWCRVFWSAWECWFSRRSLPGPRFMGSQLSFSLSTVITDPP